MTRRLALLCAVAALVFAGQGHAQALGANTQTNRTAAGETVTKILGSFTVAAVGDLIMPAPVNREEPGFQALIDRIRKADVGVANLESPLVDLETFEGPYQGSLGPLASADAIKAMGFDMVSTANNHTFDGAERGMFSTNAVLDRLGIVHAGTGRDLQEARQARFLETPKGRVGLISVFSLDDASFIGPRFYKTEATAREGRLGGAPGLNPLHLTKYNVVSPDELAALRQIAHNAYGADPKPAAPGKPDRFKFFGEWYEAGANPGALKFDINPEDERDILRNVTNGKIYADFLIVAVHAHQATTYRQQGSGGVDHTAPDFLIKFAHEAIDAGADMFVVHGVHALHGVEIYKGRPIFYGTSNFSVQTGLMYGRNDDIIANNQAAMEGPATQDGLLTTTRFENGKLAEVRLYPAALGGAGRPISRMGVPTTPTLEDANRILRGLQDYSKPFGTRIAIENGVGVIRLPK